VKEAELWSGGGGGGEKKGTRGVLKKLGGAKNKKN